MKTNGISNQLIRFRHIAALCLAVAMSPGLAFAQQIIGTVTNTPIGYTIDSGDEWLVGGTVTGQTNRAIGVGIKANVAVKLTVDEDDVVTAGGFGMQLTQEGSTVLNSGDIHSQLIGETSEGIRFDAADAVLTNYSTGAITGAYRGVHLMLAGTVNNYGTIISIRNNGKDGRGIYSDFVDDNTKFPTIINNYDTGSITGGKMGISIQHAGGVITNAGMISGGDYGIYLPGGGTIYNTGTIIGTGGGENLTSAGIHAFVKTIIYNRGGTISGGDYAIRIVTSNHDHEVHLWTEAETIGKIEIAGPSALMTLNGEGEQSLEHGLELKEEKKVRGTLQKLDTGQWTLGGDADYIVGKLKLDAGTLNVFTSKELTVDDAATFEAGTVFGVDDHLAMAAGTLVIGSNVTLNITSYSGIKGVDPNDPAYVNAQDPVTYIHTTDGITGDFATITIAGTRYYPTDPYPIPLIDRYINSVTVQKSGDGKDIVATLGGLVWYNQQPDTAHGTFNIASGGFTLNAVLADNTTDDAHYDSWDGKSLTKTGDGTLILTGGNTATGTLKHDQGGLELRSRWAGDYLQDANAGTFTTTDGAEIVGNAAFHADVDVQQTLTVGGNLTLGADSNLMYAPGTDVIDIGGSLAGGGGTLTVSQWVAGNYDIFTVAGAIPDDLSSLFGTVDFGDDLTGRQGYEIKSEANTVVLSMFTANRILTWGNTQDNGWGTQNAWLDEDDKNETFMDGDVVIFDGRGESSVDINADVSVGGMVITAGRYTFSGRDITTTAVTTLKEAAQTLVVTGDTTIAIFNNPLNFEKGMDILAGATVTLDGTAAVETAGTMTVSAGSTLNINASKDKLSVGVLSFGHGANITAINAPIVTAGKTETIPDVITSGTAMDAATLSEKLDVLVGLRQQTALFSQDDMVMALEYTGLTTQDFADLTGQRDNIRRLSSLLDDAFANGCFDTYESYLRSMQSADEVLIALDALGAGEVAVDGMTMALWKPWRSPFRRMNDQIVTVTDAETAACSLNGCCPSYELWCEGYYAADNIDASVDALSYRQRRGGMILGADRRMNDCFTAGLLFAYGQPRAYNRLAKVEADDYTVGFYGQLHLCEYLYANTFLAYGHQQYDYTNRCTGYDTSYSGNAFYASVEFVRPICCSPGVTLQPLFAIDYQQVWMDGFTDAGSGLPAVQYADGDMFQLLLRLGLNSRIVWTDRVNLTTRLQYACNPGDRYGEVGVSFAGYPDGATFFRGANLGRNMLNLGFGGEMLLGYSGRTRLYADYDFVLADHAHSHSGFVGIEHRW